MYRYVGNLYHGHIFYEGKALADDHFLVVDEYERPGDPGYAPSMCCLLMSIRTGKMHEVYHLRLSGPHYRLVA